VPLSKTLNP